MLGGGIAFDMVDIGQISESYRCAKLGAEVRLLIAVDLGDKIEPLTRRAAMQPSRGCEASRARRRRSACAPSKRRERPLAASLPQR